MCIFKRITNWLSGFLSGGKSYKKTPTQEQMYNCISSFMTSYAQSKNGNIENVAYIFVRAKKMVLSSSEKELVSEIRTNGISPENAALNILQNCAMMEIKYVSIQDAIKGLSDDGPYHLFHAVNDEKLTRGYVSQAQYEENKMLGDKLRYVPRDSLIL